VKGCPFNIPRISKVDTRPTSARCAPTAWRGGRRPACAKACPTQAIVFGPRPE
jgi:formate dehydrogenase iron-sulfur subunit